MITAIPPIPEIPEELRLAARQGRLVPFVGAGVSQLAGCPGWPDFADQALIQLACNGKLNHAVLDGIRGKRLSPRIRIALALDWARQNAVEIDFETILHPPNWELHPNGIRIYQALSGLSRHFVTTNYDLWLDSFVPMPQAPVAGGEVLDLL